MKKILCILSVFAIILCCFAGCSKKDKDLNQDSTNIPVTSEKKEETIPEMKYPLLIFQNAVSLPGTVRDFVEAGCFVISSSEKGVHLKSAGKDIILITEQTDDVEMAKVQKVTISSDVPTQFSLNRAIVGVSTSNQIKKNFGEPTELSQTDSETVWVYKKDDVIITLTIINDKLQTLDIEFTQSV